MVSLGLITSNDDNSGHWTIESKYKFQATRARDNGKSKETLKTSDMPTDPIQSCCYLGAIQLCSMVNIFEIDWFWIFLQHEFLE